MRDDLLTGAAVAGALACLAFSAAPAVAAPMATNVILMISDGCSSGCWDAAAYYQYGSRDGTPYADFPVQLGMTTTPLNTSTRPTGDPTPQVSYDPAQAWNTAPKSGDPYQGPQNSLWPQYFEGYAYQRLNWADSAAAGTAIASGEKTYNNAINWANQPAPQGGPIEPIITEIAKQQGKATGAISSVPFSHATPAAFGAKDVSRNNYIAIANDMLFSGTLDVVMGGGHPLYSDDGQLLATPQYRYIGEADFAALSVPGSGWTVIEDKSDFEALANGTLQPSGKVLGLAKVASTLQFNRTEGVQGTGDTPSGVAFNPDVPSLATMTKAALNLLGGDPDGLFLMVEGGAVDWAAHIPNSGVNPDGTSTRKTERQIEEMVDFNDSVQVVLDWIADNGGWEKNLLIITTDHGNGLPLGPASATVPFQAVINNGKGQIPGVLWHFDYHTNEVVRLWAQGAGADRFYSRIVAVDPGLPVFTGFQAPCSYGGVATTGCYVDNTDVFRVMASAMVPAPGALLLFGIGALCVARWRRRA